MPLGAFLASDDCTDLSNMSWLSLTSTPLYQEAARRYRYPVARTWSTDETYIRVAGQWQYAYRAIDEYGQVVDVYFSATRDAQAAERFFRCALEETEERPTRVTTDQAACYPPALERVLPEAEHLMGKLVQQRIERDHQHVKGRTRPMRGFKTARGYLQLLRRRALADGREPDVRYADQVALAHARLQRMIDALLDAGRLEQGLFALELRPVDLAGLVHDTVETLRAPEADLTLRGPRELVTERVDPERLRQALENLLGNALAHAPEGTPVTVELTEEQRAEGAWAVLAVRDAGPGIAPEVLPTLFDRFTRGAGSSGLGLGLYLARGIATAHGGTLTVESRLGAGTTFRLALPLAGAQQSRRRQGR